MRWRHGAAFKTVIADEPSIHVLLPEQAKLLFMVLMVFVMESVFCKQRVCAIRCTLKKKLGEIRHHQNVTLMCHQALSCHSLLTQTVSESEHSNFTTCTDSIMEGQQWPPHLGFVAFTPNSMAAKCLHNPNRQSTFPN